jgi:hypothetical protein
MKRKKFDWIFTPLQLERMIREYNNIKKDFGWKAILAHRWNLDPRNIDRWIAKVKHDKMKIFGIDMRDPYIKDNKKTLRPGEVWLKGFENLYYTNNKGEIWSYPSVNRPNKIMKPQILNSGYPILSLSDKTNKKKSHLIGRLILSSYCESPKEGNWIVSYRDSNKLNVAPNNLYWAEAKTKQHKRAENVDLIKDGETISFIGINKARLFLKTGWGKTLREAADSGTLIKGYRIVVKK